MRLKRVDDGAFQGCRELARVVFGATELSVQLGYLGKQAFSRCTGLLEADLSRCLELECIDASTFHGCSALASVRLPSSLVVVKHSAFRMCWKLTDVNLSSCTALERIGKLAFADCGALGAVDLSGCTSLVSIAVDAFSGCSALHKLLLPAQFDGRLPELPPKCKTSREPAYGGATYWAPTLRTAAPNGRSTPRRGDATG